MKKNLYIVFCLVVFVFASCSDSSDTAFRNNNSGLQNGESNNQGGSDSGLQNGESNENTNQPPKRNDNSAVKSMKGNMIYVKTDVVGDVEIDRYFQSATSSNIVEKTKDFKTKDLVEYNQFDEHFYTLYEFCYNKQADEEICSHINVISHPIGCCLNYTPDNYVPHTCGEFLHESGWSMDTFDVNLSKHCRNTYYYNNTGNLAVREMMCYDYEPNAICWYIKDNILGETSIRSFNVSDVSYLSNIKNKFVAYGDEDWLLYYVLNDDGSLAKIPTNAGCLVFPIVEHRANARNNGKELIVSNGTNYTGEPEFSAWHLDTSSELRIIYDYGVVPSIDDYMKKLNSYLTSESSLAYQLYKERRQNFITIIGDGMGKKIDVWVSFDEEGNPVTQLNE